MKKDEKRASKELYQELRQLTCAQLWEGEVARFNRATPQERMDRVAVIRAVGVVFAESGTIEQKSEVRKWLRGLLHDPAEKIRRYAMTALPKIGAGAGEEAELLALLRTTSVEREKKSLGQTLEKIGGVATLRELGAAGGGAMRQTEQKIKASLMRSQQASVVRLDRVLADGAGLRIHLRGRDGLENIMRGEVEEWIQEHGKFRFVEMRRGVVVIAAIAPFSLADIYSLRCFDTVGLVAGEVSLTGKAVTLESGGPPLPGPLLPGRSGSSSFSSSQVDVQNPKAIEATAAVITSALSRRILKTFTEGAIRYRLEYAAKGHQRGAVRSVANRAYELCPEILNDPRQAPWSVAIYPGERVDTVELSPQLSPDPRYAYRQQFVPAASHPPLAACMARLAGKMQDEIVWDPFCGSGVELIERAKLGGVKELHGTDRSAEAIATAEANCAAAELPGIPVKFTCCDFRDSTRAAGLGPNSVTLIISNPPLGKRVPIPNLRGLMEDLLMVSAAALRRGGRLVFANPLQMDSPSPALKLKSRQTVDFGGFDCRVELYEKVGEVRMPPRR